MDSWKITLLGSTKVGKTALTLQFILNYFPGPEAYAPNIDQAYRKQMVIDDMLCFVEVIDDDVGDEVAGQVDEEEEGYAPLREQLIRDGDGCILIYSVASRLSFERIEISYQLMNRVNRASCGGQHPPVFLLVGNKSDIDCDIGTTDLEREISYEEGAQLAERFGCDFMETSAKTGQNVEDMFIHMVRALRHRRDETSDPVPANHSGLSNSKAGSFVKTKKNLKKRCVIT
jgi:GTPase KRas protein